MPYLNVDEVETALALAAGPANAAFTELLTLPHRTWERRTCQALRIHHGNRARGGVYLLGGVHAREWGSPDILVNFVQLLTDAYRDQTGIAQGGARVSAAEVRRIVEALDVVVFPQANPDGRHYSMTVDPMWRKNRRPVEAKTELCPSGGGNGPGVDVNRNYDFLWDFPAKFSPDAPVMTSTDPCSEIYRGPGPASEPETANVTWLLDRFPSLRYFIDVHSFGEDILYNWGDDDDQTTDPAMDFRNPAYDGQRGIPDAAPGGDPGKYRENNTFGAVAFTSYGAFWLSFAAYVKVGVPGLPSGQAYMATGLFLLAWTIFTAYMTIGALRTNGVIATIFVVLLATFVLLTVGELAQNEAIFKIGGWAGIVTAMLAWYGSAAAVVNSTWGRAVLPVFPIKK